METYVKKCTIGYNDISTFGIWHHLLGAKFIEEDAN